MLRNIKQRPKINGIIFKYIMLCLSLLIILFFSMNWLKTSRVDQYLKADEKLVTSLYHSLIDEYKIRADILFFNRINKKNILSIYKGAQTSPEKTRKLLYAELIDMYNNMSSFHLKQLQFHLPNNDSFLRFHSPNLYGDNLTDIRETVRYVNENHRPVSGFEDGRVSNAYRFVYPLSYEGTHIGSVEISVSMKEIVDNLSQLLDSEVKLLLEKSIVDKKVFYNEQSKYIYSNSFGEHMIEIDENKKQDSLVTKILEKSENVYRFKENIDRGEIISFTETVNDNNYIMTFLPINQAITKNTIAHLVIVKQHDEIKDFIQKELIITILMIFLVVLITYVMYTTELKTSMLEKLSITDGLTGIYNRMYFDVMVEDEISRAKRGETYLSFLMLDIDFFKQYNDTYGHQAGDEVLIKIATLLEELLSRVDDYCFRLGGEEFGVLFIGLDKAESIIFANRFKDGIENLKIPHSTSSVSEYVTASFGLVVNDAKDIGDKNKLYREADMLLYQSKESGRNKLSC